MKLVKINKFGRRIGESHPRAILSDHEIDLLITLLDYRDELVANLQREGMPLPRINQILQTEQLSYRELGIKFEVHKQTVAQIKRGARRCQTPSRVKWVAVPQPQENQPPENTNTDTT